ncbi:MAG TPA: relaxase/mobilization nuclease domain-containing protein [Dysgonomonas sp.]|uniref:relaxase/mobilization nuclease domain-containing protein n=1 Tax=unclassified Dysgonomonas TaxID=2630389 RepID=UPI0025BDD4E7|nr:MULTISPECIES: relaxase/mobilization nuclease domain-containing protein [unclassified Dysgonomonas]HML65975.1 relaxase/mobilization nuclease domain-containing protein [Dysgonomonas sp.]
MIAKNIKGKSFKGCVQYVMNETAELLEAEGVWADNAKDMIRSFAMQRSGRKEIKQPVGHIPISFAPEDKERMTNDFMVQLAKEYMQEMGIKDTQYIIVRHHNADNEHLHIVYNRINNDLKLISVNNDYKRNIKTCKKLKDKYNLTYGKGKDQVKREKLNDPDKVKYYIYDAIKAVLSDCKNPADLRFSLKKFGVKLEYKYKRTTNEIEGVSFRYNNIAFKGSQIDRKFSFGNLKKVFEENIRLLQEQAKREQKQQEIQARKGQSQTENKPKGHSIGGVELTPQQWQILEEGGFIYLEGIKKKDSTGNFSSYVFLNNEKDKAFSSKENPDGFVKYGKYEMRIRDKMLIEAGHVTKAKVKWWGGHDFAYPYLWKENKRDKKYIESWNDPRISKVNKENKSQKQSQQSDKRKLGPKLG